MAVPECHGKKSPRRIRAHLAELGIVAPVGRQGVEQLLGIVADPNDKRVPEVARVCIAALGAQLRVLKAQILEFDRMIIAWHRSNETSKRLDEIPGVGPALATGGVRNTASVFASLLISLQRLDPRKQRVEDKLKEQGGELLQRDIAVADPHVIIGSGRSGSASASGGWRSAARVSPPRGGGLAR